MLEVRSEVLFWLVMQFKAAGLARKGDSRLFRSDDAEALLKSYSELRLWERLQMNPDGFLHLQTSQ
ncbi:hypothetical protein CUV01_09895 [Paracoccus tegillarcae]|uniref:Uncharacterized protein n=1 Tax=Paracoccus tegillarcae TaxID=1529068 RepID=A0A2K9EFD1_9RHOB|nr:hypothetical protein CUV01_09895 [Paracoccus tegillarcae]